MKRLICLFATCNTLKRYGTFLKEAILMTKYNRDEAYTLKNSAAHKTYYNNWAKTYDRDFIQKTNYIYPQEVCEVMKSRLAGPNLVLADIGCGTGVIGVQLHNTGWIIDGFDISSGMLEQAKKKKVYRRLVCLDLTKKDTYPKLRYTALVSSGTFTFGHLGASELEKMLILCSENAHCFIGINYEHFVSGGFENVFQELILRKAIADFEIVNIPIYESAKTKDPMNRANLCIFRFIGK